MYYVIRLLYYITYDPAHALIVIRPQVTKASPHRDEFPDRTGKDRDIPTDAELNHSGHRMYLSPAIHSCPPNQPVSIIDPIIDPQPPHSACSTCLSPPLSPLFSTLPHSKSITSLPIPPSSKSITNPARISLGSASSPRVESRPVKPSPSLKVSPGQSSHTSSNFVRWYTADQSS